MDIDDIIVIICDNLNISVKSIYLHDTHKNVSIARNFIYYYLHYNVGMSYTELSKKFKRNRRGVICRVLETKFRIENDKNEKLMYEKAVSSIYQ